MTRDVPGPAAGGRGAWAANHRWRSRRAGTYEFMHHRTARSDRPHSIRHLGGS